MQSVSQNGFCTFGEMLKTMFQKCKIELIECSSVIYLTLWIAIKSIHICTCGVCFSGEDPLLN